MVYTPSLLTTIIPERFNPVKFEHSSIQPHSQGELFPCVIGYCERYPEGMTAENSMPSISYPLTLDGHTEEYATREDAEMVARALLTDSALRAKWRAKAPAYPPAYVQARDGRTALSDMLADFRRMFGRKAFRAAVMLADDVQ